MAIVETTSAPISLTNLLLRIRRTVGDEDTDVANQRWTTLAILDAVNMEIVKIETARGMRSSGAQEDYADLTYTALADSVVLPAGPRQQPVTRVEDISNPLFPLPIQNVSAHAVNDGFNGPVYAIRGNTIVLRPNTARELRIWHIRAPFVYSTQVSDQHPLPMSTEELIGLGAAIRLQEVDDEVPPGRRERYNELWLLMLASAKKTRGPRSIRNDRRFQ